MENPYQPPQAVTDRDGPRRWPYLGWLTPVVTWTPALLLLGLATPQFFELFDQLQERAEMPLLSSYVLAAARLSRSLLHLPTALFLAGLIAGDVAIYKFSQRRRLSWAYALWQTALCACGMIAAALIVIGLLLPIIR